MRRQQQQYTDAPRRHLEHTTVGGATLEILRILAVARTLSTSSRSEVHAADTAYCPRSVLLTAHTVPVLTVFRPSVLLILPVFAEKRLPVPQYSHSFSVLAVRNTLDTPDSRVTPSMKYTGSTCVLLAIPCLYEYTTSIEVPGCTRGSLTGTWYMLCVS